MAAQILNLHEFAEWLRVNGPPEYAQWADEILADQETLDCVADALRTAGHDEYDPVRGVEKLDEANEADAATLDGVRQVLVDAGALAADDTSTPLPDLLRTLLS